MPPEKSKRELRRADLPVEVWARVATQMPIREWAKASGTCRSTRAVRLKNLTINRTPAAGVQWASRMLDGAEALCLSPQSLQQVAQGVARGLHSIKHLQQLVIDTPPSCAFSGPTLPALSCLPWLLAQVLKLEVLVAPAGTMPWIPPLATLKHLNIKFFSDAGNICEAVPGCIGLETLSLLGKGRPRSKLLSIGNLEMDGLPHLRVCVLKAIAADGILVPKACRLHIDVSAGPDMQRSIWRDALANIDSIDVGLPHPDAASVNLLLNRTVNPLENLRILNIQVHSAEPVLNLRSFGRVNKLRISGGNLALQLPAGVCWDALELKASDKLALYFEDLRGFPAAVPRFASTYGHLCGTQALELCAALAVNGVKCAFQEKVKRGKSMFWYPAGQASIGCCCGACLDCLVASGQAVGHVAEVEPPGLRIPPDRLYMFDDLRDGHGGRGSV